MAEVPIKLRKRYITGYSYKNQKSPIGRAGNKSKGKKKTGKSDPVIGRKVLFINLGDKDFFYKDSNDTLPKRGMVVEHNGDYFRDFRSSAASV